MIKNRLHMIEEDLDNGIKDLLTQMVDDIEQYLDRIAFMDHHYPPKDE